MSKSRILKNSLLYIGSDAIFGGLPVILLPVFSFYLLPKEYALYTNILILMNLFSVFIDFSASGYYGVNFFLKERIISREEVFMNSIRLMLLNTFLLGLIISLFIKQISSVFFIPPIHIYISLFFGLIININTLYLTKLRFYDKVNSFVRLRLFQVVVHSILAAILIICLKLSWKGRYLGHFLSILSISPFVYYAERKNIKFINFFSSSWKYLIPPFLFGLTLLPHVFSSWIKTGLDRILLSNSVDVYANGIYSTAFQISVIISLIGIGFNKAFSPILYKKINDKSFNSVKIIILNFIILNFIFIFIFIFISPFFIKHFLSEKYINVIPIVPYIIIAQGFLNIYIILSNILFHIKKTFTLSMISVFSAITHVFLLYFLINKYEELGAALSFLFSAIIQTILTAFFVYKKAIYIWK